MPYSAACADGDKKINCLKVYEWYDQVWLKVANTLGENQWWCNICKRCNLIILCLLEMFH